ncbi:ribosome small subunit-dependent GTPase A [Haliea sp. E17]|uniref:ribosome small subunit-dependent GTPase A n=1 Tax=Haliea sp. E17 TaxID=3401576 RepID=UPI003AB0B4C9
MNYQHLPPLGWQPFFQQQLSLDEWEREQPARVVDYQRSVFSVHDGERITTLAITPNTPEMTVGDWVLLDAEGHFSRLLERSSLFARKAAGSRVATQLIAANIDSVFIVCSLNQDFSLNRIERYLALAHEAGVEPVVVLSKADLCATPDTFLQQVTALDPLLQAVLVNGLDADSCAALAPWCGSGRTVALMGSSGVGKSTLVNTLLGRSVQHTSAIRGDDDEGRHTTTSRSLHPLTGGGLLIDTPGMRELQLADCAQGVEATFADISELAQHCRFPDCQHQSEPGCAITAAIETGELDARRLASFHKLMREQAMNAATLAEKRAHSRKLGKLYRSVQSHKPGRK